MNLAGTEELATKIRSYESLIFFPEEKAKVLADLIHSVQAMAPHGEGIFPGRLHASSDVPHHTLSATPHYADNQTGRISQTEAVAFETLWTEINEVDPGLDSGVGIPRGLINHFKKIFKISKFLNEEALNTTVEFNVRGMDWFYQEILMATFIREAMLGEIQPLIELHKSELQDPKSLLSIRYSNFEKALKMDDMVIGKNVTKQAVALGSAYQRELIERGVGVYNRHKGNIREWYKAVDQGLRLGARMYEDVLTYAIGEGLMPKFISLDSNRQTVPQLPSV